MPQSPEILFDRSNPVVRSAGYPRSRAFYADQLGFSVVEEGGEPPVEEGGEPPRFGIFKRGKAFLFVDAWNGGPTLNLAAWSSYVHVAGLQALHDTYASVGAKISARSRRRCTVCANSK